MTTALCLGCGELKFGAFCRCPACGVEPVEEEKDALSMRLTDHYLAEETLHSFGSLVQQLRTLSHEPQAIREAMICFLRMNHPEVFDGELPAEGRARGELLLNQINLPAITPRPSVKELLRQQMSHKKPR